MTRFQTGDAMDCVPRLFVFKVECDEHCQIPALQCFENTIQGFEEHIEAKTLSSVR